MNDLMQIAIRVANNEDQNTTAAFNIKNLFKGLADKNLKDELDGIYNHLSKMEQLFLDARDSTDDPTKKAILTGMYQDWLNFKSDNWREYMYMLES